MSFTLRILQRIDTLNVISGFGGKENELLTSLKADAGLIEN